MTYEVMDEEKFVYGKYTSLSQAKDKARNIQKKYPDRLIEIFQYDDSGDLETDVPFNSKENNMEDAYKFGSHNGMEMLERGSGRYGTRTNKHMCDCPECQGGKKLIAWKCENCKGTGKVENASQDVISTGEGAPKGLRGKIKAIQGEVYQIEWTDSQYNGLYWETDFKVIENGKVENAKKYTVTRKFTSGSLEGIEHTEDTDVEFEEGQAVKNPIGGSPYIITKVVKNAENCASCNGTGKAKGKECKDCNGTGYSMSS